MRKYALIVLLITLLGSCEEENDILQEKQSQETSFFISAVDISRYPEISITNPTFFDLSGEKAEFLDILKANGVNTIRLRLWVNPATVHSSYEEVRDFAKELKFEGFKIWLSLHYSDTWADPGHQKIPDAWNDLNYEELKKKVKEYTSMVVAEINPEYIQIGNEINPGFLFPHGRLSEQPQQFKELLAEAALTVRTTTPNAKIILHFAGINGAEWFFNQVKEVDYDIIGLSFYPKWHGKSFQALQQTMATLYEVHQKDILIAETAYPFTLNWNDWTNNIIGLEEQLILPEYPASPIGQQKFINKIKESVQAVNGGIGFCYWGAELIAWKGKQSQSPSPCENQALFNFNNQALPVLSEFNVE